MIEILNFSVVNNTSGIVPVSLFGNLGDAMDNSNATTQYAWNLGAFTITNENRILLQFRGVNDGTFTFLNISFSGTSVQDVCDVLNTQNLGSFFITTSGANTIINNYNQNIVFGTLTIYNPTSSTTLTYDFSYSGSLASGDIYKNAVLQLTTTSPSNTNGTIGVVGGDTILLDCVTPLNLKGTNVFVYNLTTSTYLLNSTQINSVNVAFPFTIVANNSYLIGMSN